MTDKEKNKIADILLDFYDEYNSNEINRPMIPGLYASKIINSLQEETVSIWHNTNENPKEEEYLICVYNDNRYKDNRYHIGKVYKDAFGRLLVSDNKNIIELCMFEQWAYIDDIILNLSNVQRTVKNWKEPAGEDLDEAASKYAKEEYNRKNPATLPDRCRGCYAPIMYAFKAGAKWQKEQMMYDGKDY